MLYKKTKQITGVRVSGGELLCKLARKGTLKNSFEQKYRSETRGEHWKQRAKGLRQVCVCPTSEQQKSSQHCIKLRTKLMCRAEGNTHTQTPHSKTLPLHPSWLLLQEALMVKTVNVSQPWKKRVLQEPLGQAPRPQRGAYPQLARRFPSGVSDRGK